MTKEKKPKDSGQTCKGTVEDVEETECSRQGEDLEGNVKEDVSNAPAEEQVESAENNTQYLRLMADFQNYKKRTEKEKGDIYAFANEKLLSEMLDVIDNFERALEQDCVGLEGFAEGMAMIFKQFKGVLEKAGLVEIEALGADFDPNFHHAVMTEVSEEWESGKVTAVMQKGYLLKKKVIRPAMVKVAQ